MSDEPRRPSSRLTAVVLVGLLTYAGEYISYLVILAMVQDKLVLEFQLGTSGAFIVGAVSGAYLVLSGLFAIPFGHLTDKYGRRVFAVAGSLLAAISMLAIMAVSFLPDPLVFLVAIMGALGVLGFGHATYTASTWAYVGDIARESNMGKSYGLLELAEYGAFAFGPGVGIFAASTLGRLPTFALSSVLIFAACGIAVLWMPESVHPHGLPDGVPEDSHGHAVSVSWKGFVSVMRNPVVAATLLTTFFMSLSLQAFYIYVPLYSQGVANALGTYGPAAGFLSTLAAGTSIFMMIPFGFAVDMTGRRMPWLVFGILLGSSSLIMVYLSHTFFLLAVAALAFGVGLAVARVSQAVILAVGSDLDTRATVMGTNHAIEHAGYGIGALAGGVLITLYGFNSTFRDLAFVLLIAGALFFVFAMWKGLK